MRTPISQHRSHYWSPSRSSSAWFRACSCSLSVDPQLDSDLDAARDRALELEAQIEELRGERIALEERIRRHKPANLQTARAPRRSAREISPKPEQPTGLVSYVSTRQGSSTRSAILLNARLNFGPLRSGNDAFSNLRARQGCLQRRLDRDPRSRVPGDGLGRFQAPGCRAAADPDQQHAPLDTALVEQNALIAKLTDQARAQTRRRTDPKHALATAVARQLDSRGRIDRDHAGRR